MPGKRGKLKSSLPAPRKRQKTSSTTEDIQTLERTILTAIQDGSSLNPLTDLMGLISSSPDPKTTHSVIYAVYRISVALAQAGRLTPERDESEEAKIVRQWLEARVTTFSELLAGLLKDDERALRIGALEIILSLIIHLSRAASPPGRMDIYLNHFRHFIHGLLLCPQSPRQTSDPAFGQGSGRIEIDVRDKFLDDNLTIHDDLRWFFLREAAVIMSSPSLRSSDTAHNLLSLLEKLNTMPTDVKELNAFWIPEFAKRPKKIQTDQSSDTEEEGDEVPDTADDWRTFFDEQEQNESAPVVKGKRRRLNQLPVHASLHILHSHRVQLSNCWLALVPHLAMSRPLSARALAILHRGVLPHMTRPIQLMDWIAGCVDHDPFDPKEPSPLLTNALSSSLWELAAHQNHYLTSISTLSKIFSAPFTRMPYAMEEFLDHTYATLFATEAKRNIKKDPAMMLQLHSGTVFPAAPIDLNSASGDVLGELWLFD
ncbi:hypothetical protein FRB96_003875 [Tulasnella sp. 330]|nr:hypothetical protein FRB96_003875 [Tulasnella sp. 330]